MFKNLKLQVNKNFELLAAQATLYYVPINRETIWEAYLNGFDDAEEKQGHNCNCCKSFLRQWGGIVAIIDNKVVSIWDNFEPEELYVKPVENLRNYVHSLSVEDVFLNEFSSCGTDNNFDSKREVVWNHFHIDLPSKFVTPAARIDTARGQKRDDKSVLRRSLEELSADAVDTALELIAQNSLYRGKESEGMLQEFQKIQKEYAAVPEELKNNFCWAKSSQVSSALSRIRNTAIGTLLINLSEGMDLDTAVTKFEQVVAPSNYKRPTSLVTPKMIEQAKEKIQEMGLLESLERRHANERDLSVENILYVDKSSTLTDVFDELAKDATVNVKKLTKVEEVSIDDFIQKILPTAKSVEALLENRHLTNMVSMLTAIHPDSPSLFKWDNPFSLAYTGNFADSIKERVKSAGGNVDGVLRVSLSWFNYDDLDLHCTEPNKNTINYTNHRKPSVSPTSGQLDVDMNAGSGDTREPVENIVWTDINKMKEGTYQVVVHNFHKREAKDAGFIVQVEYNGEIFDFEHQFSPKDNEYKKIVEFDFSKANGIIFKEDVKSQITSKEKWGLKTNQFVKVRQVCLSPNYWNGSTGHKHFLFMLDKCINDEAVRPFFNEFLKTEFDENRKVFEILGAKLKVENTDNQLSGLGFSETQNNSLIVKVQGAFSRTLKINF